MEFSVLIAFFLLATGLALVVAEVFIPSGGVIAALAAVCFGFSGWYAYSAWWESAPHKFWAFTGSGVALIPATAIITLWILSKTRLGSRVLLEGPKREEVDPYARDAQKRTALVGQYGRTATLMAPGGLVDIAGERHHAVAEGTMLEPGEPVKVVAVRGNRVVVRPAPAAAVQDHEQNHEEQNHEQNENSAPSEKAPTEKAPTESAEQRRNGNGEPRRHVDRSTEPGVAPLDFEIPEG